MGTITCADFRAGYCHMQALFFTRPVFCARRPRITCNWLCLVTFCFASHHGILMVSTSGRLHPVFLLFPTTVVEKFDKSYAFVKRASVLFPLIFSHKQVQRYRAVLLGSLQAQTVFILRHGKGSKSTNMLQP